MRRPTRGMPSLARLLAYTGAAVALGIVLAAGSALAGTDVAVADPTPAPAPGVPDPGVRPSPNPDPTTPGATPSPIGPPPITTPTPAPSTPTPGPSQGPPPPGWNPPVEDGADDPGLFDIPGQVRKAINDFFAWVVEGALNPVLSALGEAVLTTPDLAGDERVRTMWTTSLVVVNAVFVLFIVVAGIVVASRETLQTSYGLKEILPRLAVAFVLVNTSLLLTGKAIELTNAVTAAIAGQGVDGHSAAAALTQALNEAQQGNTFLLTLMVLGVLVMAIVVIFTFVLRIAFLAILLGIAPLALICHALPQTEQLAFTWWRAFAACLGIQVGQAVVLLAALRMFLTPAGDTITGPGFTVGIPTPSRLVSILVVAAMVWLLLKIPGWMRHLVLGPLTRSGGRGLVGQIVHTVLLVKTLGAAAGLIRTGGHAAHRAARASAPPYTRTHGYAATAARTGTAAPYPAACAEAWPATGAGTVQPRTGGPHAAAPTVRRQRPAGLLPPGDPGDCSLRPGWRRTAGPVLPHTRLDVAASKTGVAARAGPVQRYTGPGIRAKANPPADHTSRGAGVLGRTWPADGAEAPTGPSYAGVLLLAEAVTGPPHTAAAHNPTSSHEPASTEHTDTSGTQQPAATGAAGEPTAGTPGPAHHATARDAAEATGPPPSAKE